MQRIADRRKKEQVMLALSIAQTTIELSDSLKQRAATLMELGFKSFDATHVACAEAGEVDVLLTTDDRLLRTAIRAQSLVQVLIKNPVSWLLEINQTEELAE